MKLKKWFKNLRLKIAIKLSDLFLSLANFFVKKEDPEDPKVWFRKTFGTDAKDIVKIMAKCDLIPIFGVQTKRFSDEEYNNLLDEERKESVKLYNLFKNRLAPIIRQDMIDKHNERVKNLPNTLPLKALMIKEENDTSILLSHMCRPTDILPPKDRLRK